MAEQTVIDELVVRMLGEDQPYLDSLERQEKATVEHNETMEEEEARYNARRAQLEKQRHEQEAEEDRRRFQELKAVRDAQREEMDRQESYGGKLRGPMSKQEEARLNARVNQLDAMHELEQRREKQAAVKDVAAWKETNDWAEQQKRNNIAEAEAMHAREAEKSGGFRNPLSMRQMRMLSHSLMSFLNAKGVEQEGHAVASSLHAVGYAMGGFGMIATSVLGAFITHTDEAQKQANKAFDSILDGAKGLEHGLSSLTLSSFKKNMTEAVEQMNPSSMYGEWKRGSSLLLRETFLNMSQEDSEKAFNKAAVKEAAYKTAKARRLYQQIAYSEDGMKDVRQGREYKVQDQLEAMKEEISLRRITLGLKGEDLKLAKLKWELDQAESSPEKYAELERVRQRSMQLRVETAQDEYRKKIRHAGMSAGGQKLEELGITDGKTMDMLLMLEKTANAVGKLGADNLTAEEKLDAFGLTGPEAKRRRAAQSIEGLDADDPARRKAEFEIQMSRSNERHAQWQQLTHEADKYRLTVQGASAAEIAWAQAAEGGLSKHAAFVKAALSPLEQQLTGSNKKIREFDQTAEEAARRQLRKDMAGLDPKERDLAQRQIDRSLSNDRVQGLQQMSEELKKYALAMEGASAADKAAAMVKQGGNADLARQVSLLGDAAKVTEQYLLPQDKYMRQQEHLDQLLKEKLISEQTYTRALGAEQAKLNKPPTPVQGVAFGSAEALSRQIAQRAAQAPVQRLKLEGEGDRNKELAKNAAEKRNQLLEQIRDLLAAQDKKKEAAALDIAIGVGLAIGGGIV